MNYPDNYGKVCGDCIHCKCRDIVTGNPIFPKITQPYCDAPEPPNYSGLVYPSDNTFTKHCKYFEERKA